MKYRIENQLDIFEFHDSDFTLVHFGGEELVVSVKHLNIHKNTEQNPSEYDMEIECARITFKGFRAPSYEPGRAWKRDANGNFYTDEPLVIFEGKEAEEKIVQELQNQMVVLDFGKKDDVRYYIDACGIEPFFVMEFCFDSVIVEWEKYGKKAWYELHRQYQYETTLATPEGEQPVKVHIICDDEDVYFKDELEKAPIVSVRIKYDSQELWGRGSDYLWVDAFADLQKQLPSGIFLKCCLTCRHGNMCPAGNSPDELFCTKDVTITQKSDLFFYTEDGGEREKRPRKYCHVCEEYKPQSDEYYTYNDYPFYLK